MTVYILWDNSSGSVAPCPAAGSGERTAPSLVNNFIGLVEKYVHPSWA
jgi:hypothetical protein